MALIKKVPAPQLKPGDRIRIQDVDEDDELLGITVTIEDMALPIFRTGFYLAHTKELRYTLSIWESEICEVVG